MKRNIMIVVVAFLLLSVLIPVYASSNEDFLQEAQDYGINTFSVTYMKDGEVTSIGTGEDSSNNIYEAGSNGKMLTAYICLKLIDEKKLSLEDTIVNYLDESWVTNDSRFQNITVRQLLSHTAGFSPSFELGIDKKLYFNPGSHFLYSGVGYMYLQQVIENVTKQPFEDVAQTYVFQPLHMTQSTFGKANTVVPFIKASSLVVYVIAPWVITGTAVFAIGFLVGLLTKFWFYKKSVLLCVSICFGFVAEMVLIGLILPRLILLPIIVAAIGAAIFCFVRKMKPLRYVVIPVYLVALLILGMILPISIPTSPEIISKEPNAAYSLKTTTNDMLMFAQELLRVYDKKEATALKELFIPQIKIDEKNCWGAGIAIEYVDGKTTFWHSGINPGMQSLFVMEPNASSAIIIMTNSDDGLEFAKEAAHKVMNINGTWDIFRTNISKIN